MIYNHEEITRRQKDLKERIDVLGKYYKKDVMDYLYSLVNLEETILKDTAFLDEFGSLDIIYDLMKFNITGRIYTLIDHDRNILQSSIYSNNSIDTPDISFKKEDAISFNIINGDFRRRVQFSTEKDKQPKLILKEVNDRSLENIENIENTINLRNEYIKELTEEKHIERPKLSLFQIKDTFKTNNFKEDQIKAEQEEIERLKKKLVILEKYGHLESEICNEVTELIIDDLGIKQDEFTKSVNRSLVKHYKNIDIVKRLR